QLSSWPRSLVRLFIFDLPASATCLGGTEIMPSLGKMIKGSFVSGVIVFFIAPIVISASVSFTPDRFFTFSPVRFLLRWYRTIIDDPNWRSALADTVLIGVLCTAIASSLGTLSAYGISRIHSPTLRNSVLVIFLAPLVVPYVSFGMSIYPVFA